MPSINRYLKIHSDRRVRTNTCEGSVGITNEECGTDNRWHQTAAINLTREQAQKLIEQLTDQMAKNW